jgi:hypothetical protein
VCDKRVATNLFFVVYQPVIFMLAYAHAHAHAHAHTHAKIVIIITSLLEIMASPRE